LLASVREKERKEMNLKRNRIENEFRIAQGLEPIPEGTDIEDLEDEDDFKPKDVLLEETARILHDLILPSHAIASTVQKHVDNLKTPALTAE